jgi:hypothetical protein
MTRLPLREPSSDDIAALAHRFWEDRGRPLGSPEIDWHRAVEALRTEQAAQGLWLSRIHFGPDTTAASPAEDRRMP